MGEILGNGVGQDASGLDQLVARSAVELTFVFTSPSDSTQLLERIGAEPYRRVFDEFQAVISAQLGRFGGLEVERDPGFVAFNDPVAAVNAAAAIVKSIVNHRDNRVASLGIRIGIHFGSALRTGDEFVGLDVNRAARICAVAIGGQVVLSEAVVNVVLAQTQNWEFKDLGRHRLKDLSEPQRLFQLVVEGVENEFPPLRSLEAFPTNLPVQLTPFIGRESDVERITGLLTSDDSTEHQRLVTLTGPGGVGKTRLSLQSAAACVEAFPDGVYFVGLASLSDSVTVLPTIAQILGVSEGAGTVLDALLRFLVRRQLLLILDNFERVLDAAPSIGTLVERCPNLCILVSSRSHLGLEREVDYHVQPLSVPDIQELPSLEAIAAFDSVALFIDRARAVKPEFALTESNAKAIVGVCARIDGIPLAIELAAARTKIFSPSVLLQRLEQSLSVLKGGYRDVPARQATLTNTIEWSYQLLEPGEQRLLNRLSVFKGGFTVEAARAVCFDSESFDIATALDSLAEKNLLQRRLASDSQERLRALGLIGEFARDKLEQVREVTEFRNRHALYFLEFAQQQTMSSHWPKTSSRHLVENEDANLHAAINWAIETHAVEIAVRLFLDCQHFWRFSSSRRKDREILENILVLADECQIGVSLLGELLNAAASFYITVPDYEQVESCLRRFAELNQTEIPLGAQARFWVGKGDMARYKGNYGEARSAYTRALDIADRCGSEFMYFYGALLNAGLARIDISEQNYGQALSVLEGLISESRDKGELFLVGMYSAPAARCELKLGNPAKALGHCLEALDLAQSLYGSGRVADLVLLGVLVMIAAIFAESNPALGAQVLSHQAMIGDERGLGLSPDYRPIADQCLLTLRQRLPEAEFEAAWSRGQKVSLRDLTESVKASAFELL